jgi:hypothetical protein
MNRQQREALVSYLPKHAFVEIKGGEHVFARWSLPTGVFRLDTMKNGQDWTAGTRVSITAETSGESVSLVTEKWDRVVKALELLEAL